MSQPYSIYRIACSAISLFICAALAGCATPNRRAPDAAPAVSSHAEVRFAVLGDSQFANPDVFERLTHEVDMMQPAFVIQVGDMINGYTYDEAKVHGEWKRFRMQIAPILSRFRPVLGNHDATTTAAEKIYLREWRLERPYYSFDEGPAHIVALDSYLWPDGDRIAPAQREWLAKDLAEFAARNGGEGSDELRRHSIFVFLHSPLWRYEAKTQGRQDWETVHAILRKYPVRMVVGGHTHEYVWEERDGIQYVVINSAGRADDLERTGGFSCWLQVVVRSNGEFRAAAVKPGSVLPLDTVDSEDRSAVPRYALHGSALRVPEWKPGEALDATVSLPMKNNLDESRTYRLTWQIPRNANVEVLPRELWVDLDPKESKTIPFRITSSAAPPTDRMPWLEMTSEKTLRSGVVSRPEEAHYRELLAQAEKDPSIEKPRMALDASVTFRARFPLTVPPEASAARRKGDIRIDGRFDEPAWSATPAVERFTLPDGSPPDTRTTTRFLYDDDALYVAAWMQEPEPKGLKADAGGAIPLTWDDDDLELFFDPKVTQREFTRLFQNSAGTRFNSYPQRIENKYFQSAYQSAVEIGDDHWSIEMRIPWKDILDASAPKPDDAWGLNIGRHRPRSPEPTQQWSGPLYNPTLYGLLVFE